VQNMGRKSFSRKDEEEERYNNGLGEEAKLIPALGNRELSRRKEKKWSSSRLKVPVQSEGVPGSVEAPAPLLRKKGKKRWGKKG